MVERCMWPIFQAPIITVTCASKKKNERKRGAYYVVVVGYTAAAHTIYAREDVFLFSRGINDGLTL